MGLPENALNPATPVIASPVVASPPIVATPANEKGLDIDAIIAKTLAAVRKEDKNKKMASMEKEKKKGNEDMKNDEDATALLLVSSRFHLIEY
uniref:Uncharacterized protein n=1 Tax=Rhabditophanes sp. KR3021 TaxID=114890 RepID=A0AC35TKD5_9BILA